MADVFISYSRQDKDFVAQLREALIAHHQDVWIDWESIPPSQAWWSEIRKGIARANNFVVVLSPQSMASPICHMEIEYARQLEKRIIPVLYAEYNREDCIVGMTKRLATKEQETTRELWGTRQPYDVYDANDADLKHINYFLFTPDAAFQSRFNELFELLQTDYEHKEKHTTLQLRATEWDRRNRDASFLLIDTELNDAQEWLTASYGKEPAPTDLHRAYIEASANRTRQLRNIRRMSVIGSLVAVLAIIFAAAATLVGINATAQVNNANLTLTPIAQQIQQGQALGRSLQYAAAANRVLQDDSADPHLALLLAIRGLKDAYAVQANTALYDALRSSQTVRVFTEPVPDDNVFPTNAIFSPNGRFILSDTGNFSLLLRDGTTGKELRSFTGHRLRVASIAFSPDGRYIISASYDGTARLWDVETGKELRVFETPIDPAHLTATPQPYSVENKLPNFNSVEFSPDGRYILTGIRRMAQLWDVATGNLVRTIGDDTSVVSNAAFSPDGRYVLTISDRIAQLWDAETGELLRTFEGHVNTIYDSAFSPNGKSIVTGGVDHSARLWDVETGKELYILTGHTDYIWSVAFSPDSRYIVTGSLDKTARLWDAATGDPLRTFAGHTDRINSVAFSPDGQYVLTNSSDRTLRLWDIAATTTGVKSRTFADHTSNIWGVAYSPNGHYVLTGSSDGTARLWDATTGRLLRTLAGHDYPVSSVAFSTDGRYVLTGTLDKLARLWDSSTGDELQRFEGHRHPVESVALSPDNRFVLTGSWDETVRLWDAATGKELRIFKGHTRQVSSVAFSPDGRYILTGAWDNTARLWDAATGEHLRTFKGHTHIVTSVAFSSNGRYVLTASDDNTARLWDAATGEHLRTFEGHTDFVWGGAFSPDGRYVLTGSRDKTVRLWDTETAEHLRTFEGHTDAVSGVAFSPDGRYILTGSWDDTARLWDTDSRDFITFACTRAYRDFTDEERRLYAITDKEPTCPQFVSDENPMQTPFPPTTTPMLNELPVWTAIPTPTP